MTTPLLHRAIAQITDTDAEMMALALYWHLVRTTGPISPKLMWALAGLAGLLAADHNESVLGEAHAMEGWLARRVHGMTDIPDGIGVGARVSLTTPDRVDLGQERYIHKIGRVVVVLHPDPEDVDGDPENGPRYIPSCALVALEDEPTCVVWRLRDLALTPSMV